MTLTTLVIDVPLPVVADVLPHHHPPESQVDEVETTIEDDEIRIRPLLENVTDGTGTLLRRLGKEIALRRGETDITLLGVTRLLVDKGMTPGTGTGTGIGERGRGLLRGLLPLLPGRGMIEGLLLVRCR